MEDEFERIMKFFSLDPKEKEARLQEIFVDSVAYFEKFKKIMLHGTPEEKKEAMEKVAKLRECVEAETRAVCERTGMTQEELIERAKNPKNFSEEQWGAMSDAQDKIKQGVEELKESISESKEKKESSQPKKKKRVSKKKWISS